MKYNARKMVRKKCYFDSWYAIQVKEITREAETQSGTEREREKNNNIQSFSS